MIGKMKDETGALEIEEFVGLKAKLYCIQLMKRKLKNKRNKENPSKK